MLLTAVFALLPFVQVDGDPAGAPSGTNGEPLPAIALFAGGSSARPPWSIEIESSGKITSEMIGRAPQKRVRPLTEAEREQLRSLVAALPADRSRYSFGTWVIDASMFFELRIKTGKAQRRFSVTESLSEEDKAQSEMKPILEILHFLYSLVGSKAASPPPRLDLGGNPK